jgi:cell division protein FtsX
MISGRESAVEVVFDYAWIAFMLATVANAALWWVRSRPYRQAEPELEDSYRSLIRGFLVWGNVPWIVMGLGILTGEVASFFDYFNPRDGGSYVHMWFGSIALLWVLGTDWIFRQNGAEVLVRHPGLARVPFRSAASVRMVWLLCVLAGVAGMVMLYSTEIQIPAIAPEG